MRKVSGLTAFGYLAYRYQLANEAEQKTPYFMAASKYHPKFEKLKTGGEDAHGISTDQKMLVVCDGVGGWGRAARAS